MAKVVYAKYALEPEGQDVHGRFSALYNETSKGKSFLMSQCVAGGMLLRECGLLELTATICEAEDYMAATTSSQRRAILLNELLKLAGGVVREAPVQISGVAREPAAPAPTPQQPSGLQAATGAHIAEEEPREEAEHDPAPIVSDKRPVIRGTADLPSLGVSTTNKK